MSDYPLFDMKDEFYAYLRREDISISELARRKGVSRNMLYNFIGYTNINDQRISTIPKILGVIDKTVNDYDPRLKDLGFALKLIQAEMMRGRSYDDIGRCADISGAAIAKLVWKYSKDKRINMTYGTAKKLLKIVDVLEGVE